MKRTHGLFQIDIMIS